MIVQLSPKYKFVCDRCGKEFFPDSEGDVGGIHRVAFLKDTDILFGDRKVSGDICEECHKEFVEIAENFFNEVNKEQAEKALAERSGE
ncbi:MAG: hypothetical protein J6S23_02450 [Clostridia bacterium]|nr:hypothetical protein [Clostridia bacterium]